MAFERKASSKTKPSRQEMPAMKKVEQDFQPAQGSRDILQRKTWHWEGHPSKERAKPRSAVCLCEVGCTNTEMVPPGRDRSQAASPCSEQAHGQAKRGQQSGENWAESVAAEQSSRVPSVV